MTDFNRNKLLSINSKKDYINKNNVYVKPNFVLNPLEIIPFNKRKDQVVYAGRLDETKGIKILFQAWKEISKYELVVCGTGPLEAWCKEYINYHQISNIKMLGFVENNKVLDIIARSKASILPTQLYEGFPMVLVESFSRGTPVIGSNLGNVGSIIVEGKNGFCIDPTSSNSIIQKVNELCDICNETFEYAKRVYSPEENYKKLISIYRSILEGEK